MRCFVREFAHEPDENELKNDALFRQALESDLAFNIVQEGQLGFLSSLFLHSTEGDMLQTRHAYIDTQKTGDLSSFRWFPSGHQFWPEARKPGHRLVYNYCSALNFKDVMHATGRLARDNVSFEVI